MSVWFVPFRRVCVVGKECRGPKSGTSKEKHIPYATGRAGRFLSHRVNGNHKGRLPDIRNFDLLISLKRITSPPKVWVQKTEV